MNINKLLTIGMATYDDFNGVYFTIQALRMYHEICNTNQVEFVIIDNNPDSAQGKETEKFFKHIKGKYIPYKEKQSSFVKYKVPDYASGKYIIIMDCHVLLMPNAINGLLEYYKNNPDCKNLVQGPMVYNDLKNYSTHWDPVWRGDMYGIWGTNKALYEKNEPFTIPIMGMGLFSFEKSAWKGINAHFRGDGGEQGYIAEKFRSWGGENICLPPFKWVHRFGRPEGPPFKVMLEDRIWNYFVGWLDVYKDPNHPKIIETYNYFKEKFPKIDEVLDNAKKTVL